MKIKLLFVATMLFATAMADERDFYVQDGDTIYFDVDLLEEFVVSGGVSAKSHKHTPTPVTMVSNEDLKKASGQNIITAISRKPGVNEITTGSGISKPVIRGLGYNRVVVENNGQRQEGQQWGDEHGIEVDGYGVRSVEVLKGPASLMYGSDAMAGVVIFKPAPVPVDSTLHADATTEFQSNNGMMGFSASAGTRVNHFFWNARVSGRMAHDTYTPGQGMIAGTAFRELSESGMIGLTGRWGTSRLSSTHYHFKPGICEGDLSEEGSRSYKMRVPFQNIEHATVLSDNTFNTGKGQTQVSLGYQNNWRAEHEEDVDKPCLFLKLMTFNYNINYKNEELPGGLGIRVGVNGMHQKSTNCGHEFLIPDYKIIDFGTFFALQKEFENVSLSGGVRYDHRKLAIEEMLFNWGDEEFEDGEKTFVDDAGVTHNVGDVRFSDLEKSYQAVTGSIGAVFHICDASRIKMNISRGFRSPNISELASNGVHEGTQHFERGNADLKPEYSLQGDLAYEFNGKVVDMDFAFFYNRVNNYIFLEADATNTLVKADAPHYYKFTQSDAVLWGGEACLHITPIPRLHFDNTFSFVKSHILEQPSKQSHLPFTPSPRLLTDLSFDFIKRTARDGKVVQNLWAGVTLDSNWKQTEVYAAGGTETPTDGYVLLNANIGMDFAHNNKKLCSLYLNGENLTNKKYYSHLSRLKYAGDGIQNPGINIGLKAVFYINKCICHDEDCHTDVVEL